jgi:hypothetical protein
MLKYIEGKKVEEKKVEEKTEKSIKTTEPVEDIDKKHKSRWRYAEKILF